MQWRNKIEYKEQQQQPAQRMALMVVIFLSLFFFFGFWLHGHAHTRFVFIRTCNMTLTHKRLYVVQCGIVVVDVVVCALLYLWRFGLQFVSSCNVQELCWNEQYRIRMGKNISFFSLLFTLFCHSFLLFFSSLFLCLFCMILMVYQLRHSYGISFCWAVGHLPRSSTEHALQSYMDLK